MGDEHRVSSHPRQMAPRVLEIAKSPKAVDHPVVLHREQMGVARCLGAIFLVAVLVVRAEEVTGEWSAAPVPGHWPLYARARPTYLP
jgi:hypothetical protein